MEPEPFTFIAGTDGPGPRGVRQDPAAEAGRAVRRLRQIHRSPDQAEIQPVTGPQLPLLSTKGKGGQAGWVSP